MARKKLPSRKKAATRKKATKRVKKPGMTPFVPTDLDRLRVETLTGLGLTAAQLALIVINPRTKQPISDRTLKDHFAQEMARGAAQVQGRVAMSLYQKATSAKHSQAAICAMFLLKCRFGWRQDDKGGASPEEFARGIVAALAAIDRSIPTSESAAGRVRSSRLNGNGKTNGKANGSDDYG